ncbi:MAG: hypothetical protein ABIP51_18100 [Bacteroidia bacterium]
MSLLLNFIGTEKVVITDKNLDTLVVTRNNGTYSFESVNRSNNNNALKSIFGVQMLVKSTLMQPSRSKDGYDKRFSKLFKSIETSGVDSFRALRGRLEAGKISA